MEHAQATLPESAADIRNMWSWGVHDSQLIWPRGKRPASLADIRPPPCVILIYILFSLGTDASIISRRPVTLETAERIGKEFWDVVKVMKTADEATLEAEATLATKGKGAKGKGAKGKGAKGKGAKGKGAKGKGAKGKGAKGKGAVDEAAKETEVQLVLDVKVVGGSVPSSSHSSIFPRTELTPHWRFAGTGRARTLGGMSTLRLSSIANTAEATETAATRIASA